MKAHLIKGSAAAKAYMSKLRSKKTKVGAVKKKAALKKSAMHKDTKSHNVNIKVVSGIGALPVGFTGKFWGVPFKIFNQFDIYGAVSAIIEDTSNGRLIVEITDRLKVAAQIESFKNYVASAAKIESYNVDTKVLEKDTKTFITNLYNEVKLFNAGKTGITAPKRGLKIGPTKVAAKKVVQSGKTTKLKLKENLKSEGLRLPHGYNVVKRITGYVGRVIIKKYTVTELKKLNPIYFEKGKDKTHGVYKRKLILSAKLNSQVMIEAQKNTFGNETFRSYVVRKINADGRLLDPHRFNTLFGAADYIGKNIIL